MEAKFNTFRLIIISSHDHVSRDHSLIVLSTSFPLICRVVLVLSRPKDSMQPNYLRQMLIERVKCNLIHNKKRNVVGFTLSISIIHTNVLQVNSWRGQAKLTFVICQIIGHQLTDHCTTTNHVVINILSKMHVPAICTRICIPSDGSLRFFTSKLPQCQHICRE